MNKIAKTIPTLPLLLGALLTTTISACSMTKTTADAPSSTDINGGIATAEDPKINQDDAGSETRKKQLEADIRAQEQRNNMLGDPLKRSDEDLAGEVSDKLVANIPDGKLIVVAKAADVTISGVVKTQSQFDKIKPLVMEIKGVKNAIVNAVVTP
jgi:hyperosmotically inducible periplasmic protein